MKDTKFYVLAHRRLSLSASVQITRHTRREAGIQCQGWRSVYVHVAWIPAIPAGMTGFETLVTNDEHQNYVIHF